MSEKKVVLGIVGSPRSDGLTNQLVTAALDSATEAGAETELVQMSECVVNPCRDCLPWVCLKNLKCTYEDDNFEMLSEKILNCGALVLGTPVYWWDTSARVRYLILKMFRIYAMSGKLRGLPALGVAIAGGTGNGLISGLKPVYHFFQIMQISIYMMLQDPTIDAFQSTIGATGSAVSYVFIFEFIISMYFLYRIVRKLGRSLGWRILFFKN